MKLKPQNDGNSAFRTMSAAEYRAAAAALQDGPRPAASRTVLEQIGSLTERRDGAALDSPRPVQPVTRPEPPCPAPQPAAPELREAPVPAPQPERQTPGKHDEPPVKREVRLAGAKERRKRRKRSPGRPGTGLPHHRRGAEHHILVEQAGSLLLIDKHAAHERILFESSAPTRNP